MYEKMLEKTSPENGVCGVGGVCGMDIYPKELKTRILQKTSYTCLGFFPTMVGLSPRELSWIFKSVPVGTVILEVYPSIPLGQRLSSFALQIEKQDAVMVLNLY